MIEHGLTAWTDAARTGRRVGHLVEAHDSIGSTNDRVRELLARGGAGIAVVAERQTAGRGRRGRSWESPPGLNLTASVGVEPALAASDSGRLGMAVALAVRDACSAAAGAPADLKWPNDVVAPDGPKLGGLLLETAVAGDRLTGAVIGFGINVNWRRADMPAELAASATSLAEVAGRAVDRIALLAAILGRLEDELDAVESGRSPRDRYRVACVTLGGVVTVETSNGTVDGLAIDVDEAGSLVVDGADGLVAISSGEVVRVRRPS
ncbi:MAG TPA: biotin--[acetyl-CoA-carboxylase] ligase [Candidatus Limnocylindrales bacterium]|nr:biotin--[acetyl-CoA-carboxylase] ligase [Candidatus Limnocylindrales bacterium]